MSDAWISFLISFAAVGLMLVLHAFLVMCEISLVKFRYRKPSEEQLDELKHLRGVARLIDNSDQTGRVVRFSKTLCTVAVGLLLMPLVTDFFSLFDLAASPDRWIVVLVSFTWAVSVHFFFAEIFPRGLAMRDPSKAIRRSYPVSYTHLTLPTICSV